MRKFTKIAIVATALASAGAASYAAKTMENDATSVSQAKFSLIQAIVTAEQNVNGKATRAEYEKTKSGLAYDVEVVSGAKVFDVRVDADKGTVISSTEDKVGQNDEQDGQDGQDG
ncbi:MAG: PepSY domain-containing protein, partial [Polaromonas sp.]